LDEQGSFGLKDVVRVVYMVGEELGYADMYLYMVVYTLFGILIATSAR